MRTHQQLEGIPYPCSSNTTLSWQRTSLTSNSQNQRCNRMVQKRSRIHRPDSGNPCHGHGSTTASSAHSNLLASSQSHLRNCTDRQVSLAQSAVPVGGLAWAAARWVALAALSVGTLGGECGSTNPSCLAAKCSQHQLRN